MSLEQPHQQQNSFGIEDSVTYTVSLYVDLCVNDNLKLITLPVSGFRAPPHIY